MLVAWVILGMAIFYLCRKEYLAEKQEFEAKNGLSKNQVLKAYKHMRGEKITFRDIIQEKCHN